MHDPTLAETGGSNYVTLTPDESRSCLDYFAVELQINDVQQLTAINLVFSEP